MGLFGGFSPDKKTVKAMFEILEHGGQFPVLMESVSREIVEIAPYCFGRIKKLSRKKNPDTRSVGIVLLSYIVDNSKDRKLVAKTYKLLDVLADKETDPANLKLIEKAKYSNIGSSLFKRLKRNPPIAAVR